VLLHCFEQCGLCLWRSAVDLVGEDHLCEDGAFLEDELSASSCGILLDDFGPGDVGGHEVRGELYAAKRKLHDLREAFDHHGLGQTGYTFEETVALGEDGNH